MNLSFNSVHTLRSIVASAIMETESTIVVIDATPTIYRFAATGMYIKHAILKGFESYPYRYGNATAVTQNASHALVCDTVNDRVMFLSLEPMQLLSTLTMNRPDTALFSQDGTLFAVANALGRCRIYGTLSSAMQNELQFSDVIVYASFSPDNRWLAVSTMDKKIHIYSLSSQKIFHVFKLDEIVETLAFSDDNNKIVAFSRDGSTHALNIMMQQQFIGSPTSEWPTCTGSCHNRHVVLVGSRSNQLFVYSNSDGAILGSMTLDYWGVTSLSTSEDKVFIGFSDGNGMIIDLGTAVQAASEMISQQQWSRLCIAVAENPLILISPAIGSGIEPFFNALFDYHPVTDEEKAGYESIVSLIISDGSKRRELMQTLYNSEAIVSFMENISEGKIQKACISAHKAPLLRQVREFHEVRSRCMLDMMHELRLLETDPEKYHEYVASEPSGCQECVHRLIPPSEVLSEYYQKLCAAATAGNFALVIDITEKYCILRQTKVYRRVMNYGEALIDKTLAMITAGKMVEADTYATKLSRIKPFALTGTDFKNQIKAYESFSAAEGSKNISKIFEMAIEFPALRTTEIFRKQIEIYRKTVTQPAMLYAQKGDTEKVKALIAPYAQIAYFDDNNIAVMKSALIYEIALYAPEGEEATLLGRYHECFGWDSAYAHVCETFNIIPNEDRKLDEISPECKTIGTFITGPKQLRHLTDTPSHE